MPDTCDRGCVFCDLERAPTPAPIERTKDSFGTRITTRTSAPQWLYPPVWVAPTSKWKRVGEVALGLAGLVPLLALVFLVVALLMGWAVR